MGPFRRSATTPGRSALTSRGRDQLAAVRAGLRQPQERVGAAQRRRGHAGQRRDRQRLDRRDRLGDRRHRRRARHDLPQPGRGRRRAAQRLVRRESALRRRRGLDRRTPGPTSKAYSPTTPLNYRAGWGFLVLTNMLPNQGNGVFTLHMRAIDAEGQSGALGSRVIDVRNASAAEPFGAIDTPGAGRDHRRHELRELRLGAVARAPRRSARRRAVYSSTSTASRSAAPAAGTRGPT